MRRSRSQTASGVTMLELIVVISVVAILLSLLMVVIQSSREAADRLACANRLRQIGLALHSYHCIEDSFPPGVIEPRPLWRRGRQLAWSAILLPHMELGSVADRIDYKRAFDHPVNQEAAKTVIPTFLCPSTPRESPLHQGRGACDFGGIFGERITGPNQPPKGTMLFDRGVRIREIRDGTTNTLIVSEDSNYPDGQWINGRNVFDQAYPINRAPVFENDIRSRHPEGANGLFADGSVRFLDEAMALELLGAICTRAGHEAAWQW